MKKTGVIDVGGGSRDIYGAGVLDYCIEHGISFPYCIGISAGSANLASFLAGQKGRNYVFYTEYFFRKDYASLKNILCKKNYVDLDYIYAVLSNSDGEYPLDYETMMANKAEFLIEACDIKEAKPVYVHKSEIKKDRYEAFKASSCLPIACRPRKIRGQWCFDGGLANPIPIQKALDDGCEKIVLILTRPKDAFRVSDSDRRFARLVRWKYPAIADAMAKRAEVYNAQLRTALEMEKEGRLLILAPDDIMGLKTLTKDKPKLKKLYQKGLKDAEKIQAFLEK